MPDFNWNENKQDLVVQQVDAVAVYINMDGNIVIRQQAFPNDDAVIVLPKASIPALIKALKAEGAKK